MKTILLLCTLVVAVAWAQRHNNAHPQGSNTRQDGPNPGPNGASYNYKYSGGYDKTFGRKIEYTMKEPNGQGTAHVHETHVSSNRRMDPQEAEAALKDIMGSMGNIQNRHNEFMRDFGFNF